MMASPGSDSLPRIITGTSGDIDRAMEVMDAAFGGGFGEGWTRSQLAGILPMSGVSLWVAEVVEGGSAAGFALSRTAADEAELLLIAVRPDHSGSGIGKLLLDHFLAHAREAAVRRVHLEVRDGNPAVELYRKFGFAQVGCRCDYYRGVDGQNHDAMTLALNL